MGIMKKTCRRVAKMTLGMAIGIAAGCVIKKMIHKHASVLGSVSYNSKVASSLYDARAKFESGAISKAQYDKIVSEL